MTKMTCHVHHVSLIFVYLHTRSNQFQKQIVQYNIKSKYAEEYLTIDIVGSEKLLVRKSCFM